LILPKNKLIVLTGVSGSGKSSLAFDTLYAEGQRRYVESLSAYSRQFLERMEKPDVDSISGICPAISIEQKTVVRNPRSTVGTTTEIYDYLRLLFARIGITICRRCGRDIKKDSTKSILDFVFNGRDEVKCYILFPLDKYAGSSNKEKIINLKTNGFFRFFCDNRIIDLNETDQDFSRNKNIYVLVDRLVLRKGNDDNRYADSIETALINGDGYMSVYLLEEKRFLYFSKRFECPDCNISYEEPNLHLFSYNNPAGACKKCKGLGQFSNFDIDKIVPNTEKSINDNAFDFFKYEKLHRISTEIKNICKRNNINMYIPFKDLSPESKKYLILGDTYSGGIRGFFDVLERR
jgi:excinuclease ABC subunit A